MEMIVCVRKGKLWIMLPFPASAEDAFHWCPLFPLTNWCGKSGMYLVLDIQGKKSYD